MGFYYNKQPIAKEDFIKTYERIYYNDCGIDKEILRKGNRSSRFAENKIEDILINGFSVNEKQRFGELKLVIAWKIGAISHRLSQDNREVIYSGDFSKTLYWGLRGVDAKSMISYLQAQWNDLQLLLNEPYSLYKKIMMEKIKGFGAVHTLTLVHFLTKGKCPIYDQFAYRASIAIQNGIMPYNNIPYTSLSDDLDISWSQYQEYSNRIENIFGSDYCSRAVDRSLFVYGHMFATKKDKVKC